MAANRSRSVGGGGPGGKGVGGKMGTAAIGSVGGGGRKVKMVTCPTCGGTGKVPAKVSGPRQASPKNRPTTSPRVKATSRTRSK
jgi:hypothetical protein